ncbi:MAG: FAD-dependent oxidoreductase [Oscillospiraceae bacterium]|nr:FAD-dependent oxidoreductase [Oscillospiraceae bacterium]
MQSKDILIIGGGPAGLAAAVAAYEAGARDILILEREGSLGGILKQCIHNGFGLHTFKEELTGPEYAQRYVDKVAEYKIAYQRDTMVIDVTPDKVVTCVSKENGLEQFQAKALILAMGCRERPRGSIGTPGWRCAGVYTAGTAQKFVNLEGLMPGKKCLILGSGDIGLIMARRMTFMGAEVVGCVELMPYSAGLKRNIVQCLNDYDIPLYLSHTVTDIAGKERLEGVTIAEVDEKLKPIEGTEKYFECDTLLLSVGLIPENELTNMAGIEMFPFTSGAVVDENLQTSADGVFACGNVLHVHDLVDFVSQESAKAGKHAWEYVQGELSRSEKKVSVEMGKGVNAIVPQHVNAELSEPLTIMFRPRDVYKDAVIKVKAGETELLSKKKRVMAPAEMESLLITPEKLAACGDIDKITVSVEV